MNIYLLQEDFSYLSSNSKGAAPFFIVFGILVAAGIIAAFARKKRSPVAKTKKRGFSILAFNKIARFCGLDRHEKKLLNFVFQVSGVKDIEAAVQKPNLLDRYFKQTYNVIMRTTEDEYKLNEQLSDLFALRNVLDSAALGASITSTKQIEGDTPVMVSTERKNYHSKVLMVNNEHITISCPENNLGTMIRIAGGTKVTVSFLIKINQGVSFTAKIPEARQTALGLAMAFPHTNKLKRLARRNYRRKQSPMDCFFFIVNVEQIDNGKTKKTKLTLDKRRIKATMLDISAGGCSIKSPVILAPGNKLKILLPYSDNTIICLGQVLRVNRDGMRITLHIKFIKVPQKSRNAINALVFDFDE
jgi:c-di-GMP-binding flagellar brake protein YcgR